MSCLRFIRRSIVAILWLITLTGFHQLFDWPILVSVIIFLIVPSIGLYSRNEKIMTVGIIVGFLGMIACLLSIKASNNRDWAAEFAVLPKIQITDQLVTIDGFRNFRWSGFQTYDPLWEKRTFDLGKIESLDLVVEPFQNSDFMAHTMLRFGFADQGYLIVSVEARREKRETFNLVAGAFRQFELIYLFGAESDLMVVRAVYRGARLYVYPIKADRQFIAGLFKDLASSSNQLHSEPRFYRSILDNCTTALVKHFDRLQEKKIGLRRETLFPAMTGKLLYQMGYMDTDLSYEQAKEHFRVDERIREGQK
jgi:hypothetical protein